MELSISIPAAFFAFVFGLLLHPISTGSHHGSTQRHLQKRLEEVFHRFSPLVKQHATLNHGDHCISPYEEKLRQQIVEELHLIATSHATLGRIKDTIKKMEEFISMNDKELCNYRLSLFCDQELKKCVCGPNRVNVSFVWEREKCCYSEGSMCSANSKIECSQETRCVSAGSTLGCTSAGPCFCQRENPPTTTPAPKSTTAVVIQVPPYQFGPPDTDENRIADKPGGSKDPLAEASSSEEEDDDDGDGEEERIIVVNIGDVAVKLPGSKPATTMNVPAPPANVEVGQDQVTAAPTPVGTAPAPTRRQELTSAIRRFEREVEAIKTLGFGASCASIAEESNYAEYRRLVGDMDCVTGENDEENLIEILSKLESILDSGNKMCNWTLHLQCNSQSKKCECRTSREDLDGFYLLFMAEGKRCVLVENSRCLSREYLMARKSPFTGIPCASEAKCIAEETKAECKTKIENCFCRKAPKPTDASKQKKKPKSGGGPNKTSQATSLRFAISYFRPNHKIANVFSLVFFVKLISWSARNNFGLCST